jgi:hypothetical protein
VGAAATLPTQRVDLRPGRGDTTEGQEAGRRIGGGAGANDLADAGGDARHSLETVLFGFFSSLSSYVMQMKNLAGDILHVDVVVKRKKTLGSNLIMVYKLYPHRM